MYVVRYRPLPNYLGRKKKFKQQVRVGDNFFQMRLAVGEIWISEFYINSITWQISILILILFQLICKDEKLLTIALMFFLVIKVTL